MKSGFILICLIVAQKLHAQAPVNYSRSMLSVMAVLASDSGDKKINNSYYNSAISKINSALIDMGYSKTIDASKQKVLIDNKSSLNEGKTRSREINTLIEHAPVDLIIETEITWIDPPGNPRDRQVRLHLKAVDSYTGAVYADNSSIQSSRREFADLGEAVDIAISRDGSRQFKSFLDQLDSSYIKLMKTGRLVSIQFGVDRESMAKFTDLIGNENLSDKIISFLRLKAFGGQCQVVGESETFMQFNVAIPLVDNDGIHSSPSWYLRKDIDAYFRQLGYAVRPAVVGNYVHFTLIKRIN